MPQVASGPELVQMYTSIITKRAFGVCSLLLDGDLAGALSGITGNASLETSEEIWCFLGTGVRAMGTGIASLAFVLSVAVK